MLSQHGRHTGHTPRKTIYTCSMTDEYDESRNDTPMIAFRSHFAADFGIFRTSILTTMSDHTGVIVVLILAPIAFVAIVAFLLIKIVIPIWTEPREQRDRNKFQRRLRNREKLAYVPGVDSWTDLERLSPEDSSCEAKRTSITPAISSPSAAVLQEGWHPRRSNRLDWSFSSLTPHRMR